MTDAEMQHIQVPLPVFVREIAREAAREVMEEHRILCPIANVENRVSKIELRSAALVGYMIGAGMFGGGTAAIIFKMLLKG